MLGRLGTHRGATCTDHRHDGPHCIGRSDPQVFHSTRDIVAGHPGQARPLPKKISEFKHVTTLLSHSENKFYFVDLYLLFFS